MANIIQLGSPFAAGQSPYDIFQDRMRTVAAIVENYKQWQEKKWDTEWQQAALSDIDKAKNQQTDILLQNINPPADKIDVEGATQFADKAMGMLQQKELMTGGLELKQPDEAGMVQKKEIMTGGLESKSVVTATAPMKEEKTQTAQSGTVSKTIPDISEFNELMKFVQDLPTGEVNWDNTLSLFEQRLQKKRSLGDAATQFLNQILGQGIPDQRARFENDFNLSKNIMQTLYPETEQQQETFDPEAFLQANPDMEITGYNSNTRGYTFRRKEQVEEKPQIDVNKLVTTLEENGMKLSSANFNPTTGNLSYSFTAEKPDTGTTKASWEQNLAKAQQFIQSNPDYEITGTNPDSGSVTISKVKKEEEKTTKTNVDDILFGDTGIIPKFIKDETIDMGMPLTEEEKDVIVSNYKIRKPTLTSEEIAEIERYFMQIGVDPYAAKLPEPVPEKGETGVQWWNPFTWGQLEEENLGKGRDKYGYVIGEKKEANGKKYEYIGNNKWKPIS